MLFPFCGCLVNLDAVAAISISERPLIVKMKFIRVMAGETAAVFFHPNLSKICKVSCIVRGLPSSDTRSKNL